MSVRCRELERTLERMLTSLQPDRTRVQRNSRCVPRRIRIRGELPDLLSTAPVDERLLLWLPDLEVAAPERLDERSHEDVHALDMLFALEVLIDLLHRIFARVLAILVLGVVKCEVAREISRDSRMLAGVDQGLSRIEHEVVVAQVGADDDVQAIDKSVQGRLVEYIALDDLELSGLGMFPVKFGSIAAKGSDLDVEILEQGVEHEAAESASGTGDADVGDFVLGHCDGRDDSLLWQIMMSTREHRQLRYEAVQCSSVMKYHSHVA
jgi:hypothetical protein